MDQSRTTKSSASLQNKRGALEIQDYLTSVVIREDYDPADAVARLKTAGLGPKPRVGCVYFEDPEGIE